MLTLWGRATSSNVQIVAWAIAELGLQAERIDCGHTYGGLDTPAFLGLNPNRLIPVLRDGDVVVWESAAILRYLGAAYGDEAFWPSEPAKRARLDMWAEWVKTTFAAAFTVPVFWSLVRTRAADRDLAAFASAVETLKGAVRILDQRLADGGPYLGGEALSFADIMAGHTLYRYFTVPLDRIAAPALDAYYARLKQRPPYAEHVMVSYEPLRAE
ncbi:MAG: glutathione S-transferase family protein [Pseudomonadota bacterium]